MSDRIPIFDGPRLEALRRELRLDPHALRQVRQALARRGESDEAALDRLPEAARARFAAEVEVHPLELFRREDSTQDGATKLLLRIRAGLLLETVILRIATGRTTLCLSSQVGCAAACEFCATGKMGLAVNLSPGEILDQLVQARQLLAAEKRSIRNLVFMGMGEPFHNEQNLYAALDALTSPELFDHPPSRILVSTVGLPEAMLRCGERYPGVNLALSLHSVRPEVRSRLIPLGRNHSLDALRCAIAELNRLQADKTCVMLEYLLLAGVNDSLEDARELAAWCDGLRVHVNLIPYNAIEDAPQLAGSDRKTREAFGAVLKAAGLPTTIRYSLGADVAAACGQLVRRENRAIRSTESARGGIRPAE
jgi:23S rRNA (adenine2503-C2)-methyltransferase